MLRNMQHRTRQREWLRPFHEVPRPAARVVCFPHAGGSATTFAPWAPAMPPEIALYGVQYPGRGDRLGEPMVETVREMSSSVAAELLRMDPTPCALFGHSLGALVAYETAVLLRDRGREPRHLFVSGSAAPPLAGGGRTHQESDEQFWATVCGLGGTDPEIAANDELRELMLPILRSDIRASEVYRPAAAGRRPLSCPVRCYHGDGDRTVDPAPLAAWGEITTGAFTTRVRPGSHFHITVNPTELADDVVNSLRRHSS
ncbi:thioesterase II family protein [Streptomyces gossypiisoli]|uniref:thioesterase II family protein n=1 Tax=Streptomyces gossypiisoli TaxID=2748864 RepID=UPI0015DA6838